MLHITDDEGKLACRPFANASLGDIANLTETERKAHFGGSGAGPVTNVEPDKKIWGALHAQGTSANAAVIRPVANIVDAMSRHPDCRYRDLLLRWTNAVAVASGGLRISTQHSEGGRLGSPSSC